MEFWSLLCDVWSRPVPPLSLLPLSGGALPEAEHAEPAKHHVNVEKRKQTVSRYWETIQHQTYQKNSLRFENVVYTLFMLKHAILFSFQSLPQQPAAPLLPCAAPGETSAPNAIKCLFPSNVATDQI